MSIFLGATLYNQDGITAIRPLVNSINKTFTDDLRGEGSFSLSLPAENATDLEIGQIIKFSYGTSSADFVFAGVIESLRYNHTSEQETVEVGGRGIRSLLEGALIYISNRTYTSKTVGYIMSELFIEAQARGALTGMTKTFTSSVDSDAVSFTVDQTLTIEEQLGSSLAEVANRHQEVAVDVWVAPNMSLNYYIERGVDRRIQANPLVLRVGESLMSYTQTIEGPVKNAALVAYSTASTPTESTRAGSISTYGRRETFLSLTNLPDLTTAGVATERTLDNTQIPSTGATIELSDNGPKPYLDFGIGDWIYLVDFNGERVEYRVRAITLAEQDDGSVRIVPELGNVKAALEERLRRLIARQEAKTAAGSADATASSIDLTGLGATGGGGAVLDEGTVISYDPLTNTGMIDAPGIDPDPIEFVNGTGQYLFPGDILVVTPVDDDNDPGTPDVITAIGITERAGTITPVTNPSGTVPLDFPFRTDNIAFPVSYGGNNSGAYYAHDLAGLLGFGTDLIIGPNSSAASATNAVNRGTTNSYQLSGSIGYPQYYLQGSRLWGTIPSSTTPTRVRNATTGVWSTIHGSNKTNDRYAFDHSNQIMWMYLPGTTGGPFFKMNTSDASPVAQGDLGTGLSNASNATIQALLANNGRVHVSQNNSPFVQWQKSSADSSNFVSTGSITTTIGSLWHIGPDGRLWSWSNNTTTNTIWTTVYNPANNSVATQDTGIIWRIAGVQVIAVQQMRAIGSSVVAFFASARQDRVVTGGSTSLIEAAVFTFNGTANSKVWNTTTGTLDSLAGTQWSYPVNTTGTTWRWSYYTGSTTTRLWQMELTFV